jgi:DNA-binding transcriptional LysR family regulator
VFQEVYRERQISGAARRLGLTQSAVSNALARLRRCSATKWLICSRIPWA